MTAPAGITLAPRVPPHNYEAEQAVLGAILLNNQVLDRVTEFLRPEHFADPAHARIYAACQVLTTRGDIANPVTLQAFFSHDGHLAEIGGTDYLARLANAVVSVVNAESYGRVVHDLHVRRALIDVCGQALDEAYVPSPDSPASALVERIETALTDLAADRSAGGRPMAAGEFAAAVMAAHDLARRGGGAGIGQPTYFSGLDERLGGMAPGDLIILAGRPSMGKSAKAFQVAANVAEAPGFRDGPGGPVAVFLLEGSKERLAERLLADRANVPYGFIRKGTTNHDQFERLDRTARDWLARLPLFIDDTPDLTVAAMRARARRIKRRLGKLALVVVDHLHLMRSAQAENRVQELALFTGQFKAMAKELGCPVLLLAQLSRGVEGREDKRPTMADLRESGAIEQDADAIIMVYREEYYLERAEPAQRPDETAEKFSGRSAAWAARMAEARGVAEFIIPKLREGEPGTVRERWDGAYQRFSDL